MNKEDMVEGVLSSSCVSKAFTRFIKKQSDGFIVAISKRSKDIVSRKIRNPIEINLSLIVV